MTETFSAELHELRLVDIQFHSVKAAESSMAARTHGRLATAPQSK